MAKQQVYRCIDCGKSTIHEKVCADVQGAERVFMGIFTLGMSEACMHYYWKCSNCGRLTRR